ncbi:MAG: hypothetical protein EBT13_12780 [Rhodobacteraceae bacterium]|nr:hypothetical protein [Paracoccaceae bacterium]
MMSDLLPCTFCGGTDAVTVQGPALRKWGVRCKDCDVWRDDRCATEEEAIAAWNRRSQPQPATGDVIETLARALKEQYLRGYSHEGLMDWEQLATALHAQIAPALRAEGMGMAAQVARGMSFPIQDSAQDAIRAPRTGELVARAIEAEAARLREGSK